MQYDIILERLNPEGVGGRCRMHGELKTKEKKIQWGHLKATDLLGDLCVVSRISVGLTKIMCEDV
jgi:hypothetical protein